VPLASLWGCWLWSFRSLEHWARACPSWMQHATMLALHAQMRKRRCLVTFSVGTSGGIWGESSLVVALANLRLGGQSLPKLSSLKVAGTDAACNSATLDCRQPGNSIEMYCSNGTLGIDSMLKTSRLKLHVRSGPVLAKPLALFSSTWWCSVGQPVSWALWEPAWLAAFAASAAKPSLMIRG
jgi:hypothetical protein